MAILPDLPQTEIAIVEMTNAFRKENKLGAVTPNRALTAAARAFAQYLAKTGKFAHEADGREPSDRVVEQGYTYCFLSENLALNLDSRGFETRQLAREVVEGWKNSPGHRTNMLHPAVTEIGVAVAQAPHKNPKYISVQLFGRPESLKVTFRIDNRSGATVRYLFGDDKEDIPPSTIVTHSSCGEDKLRFEVLAPAPSQFLPRDGDLFQLSKSAAGALKIELERK